MNASVSNHLAFTLPAWRSRIGPTTSSLNFFLSSELKESHSGVTVSNMNAAYFNVSFLMEEFGRSYIEISFSIVVRSHQGR